MHITDHLQPCCVALRQQADSLPAAIHQLVELVQKSGCLTDTVQFEQDVLEREKMGGICMGRGLAIPHAKSAGVAHAELAALTLDPPLPCDTPDGEPVRLLFLIAAPADANDLHVQMLAGLATLLLDEEVCRQMLDAPTPTAFCSLIARHEEPAPPPAEESPAAETPPPPPPAQYRLLAVTACPMGVAHTYLAAEALRKAAQERGVTIKVETNGAVGVNDELESDEIAAADCIIIAADKGVSMARFVGKRLVQGARLPRRQRLPHQRLAGAGPRNVPPPDERHLLHDSLCGGGRRHDRPVAAFGADGPGAKILRPAE